MNRQYYYQTCHGRWQLISSINTIMANYNRYQLLPVFSLSFLDLEYHWTHPNNDMSINSRLTRKFKKKKKKVLVSQITIYNSSIDLWQFSLSKISCSLLLISHSNPLLCSNFRFKSTSKQFSKVQKPSKMSLFYFLKTLKQLYLYGTSSKLFQTFPIIRWRV